MRLFVFKLLRGVFSNMRDIQQETINPKNNTTQHNNIKKTSRKNKLKKHTKN